MFAASGEIVSHSQEKGDIMFVQKITGCAAAAAIAALMSIGSAHAAMSPVVPFAAPQAPDIHHVDCAVGFHVGPVGTCVVGVDNPPPPPPPAVVVDPAPVVIEHRSADEGGCETKSVNRTDAVGNSETRTRTNCN
jgi:hypothetical protein